LFVIIKAQMNRPDLRSHKQATEGSVAFELGDTW